MPRLRLLVGGIAAVVLLLVLLLQVEEVHVRRILEEPLLKGRLLLVVELLARAVALSLRRIRTRLHVVEQEVVVQEPVHLAGPFVLHGVAGDPADRGAGAGELATSFAGPLSGVVDGIAASDLYSPFEVGLLVELLVVAEVRARSRTSVVSLALAEALLHSVDAAAFRTGLLLGRDIRLDAIELQEHGLDLDVIVLSEVADLRLQLINLLILLLLTFDEYDAVVEGFFVEVVLVVLPQDFDLATKIIVRALDELELAHLPMSLQILPLGLLAALVVAIDDFPEAPLIVCLQVLVDDGSLAPIVLAVHLPEVASDLVRLNFTSLELDRASFLEKTLALVGALHDLERAALFNMLNHPASLNTLTTIVFALDFELDAVVHDVLVHASQWDHEATMKDALDDSVRALVQLVLLQIPSHDLAADVADRASHGSVPTFHDVLFDLGDLRDLRAAFVRASDGQLVDETAYRDVWPELPDDRQVTERAVRGLRDAPLTEEVVAARRLHCINEDVKTNRAEPSVIGEAARCEVREIHSSLLSSLASSRKGPRVR